MKQTKHGPCGECGGAYLATRNWQKFCSPVCRREFHRKHLGESGALAHIQSMAMLKGGAIKLTIVVAPTSAETILRTCRPTDSIRIEP